VAEKKAYLLRLDAPLHEALQKWAADELRSVNAQIEFALRRALQGLSQQEREIVELRYGLDGEDRPVGVQEIGKRFEGKLSFKYTGPWPPYNFVTIRLKLERGTGSSA